MKKKMIVLSLGGSLIVPDKINVNFLKKFKKTILSNTRKYKFVIVCGGGSVARKYVNALNEIKANYKLQCLSGISITRVNARFMNYFFNKDPKQGIPHKLRNIKKYLKKHDVVFCGALEYKPDQTSDGTAAEIAKYFKTFFINITNVAGLYDQNPKKFKNAKFIPKITWSKFNKMVNQLSYKPGQHFILDQSASKIILKNKIKTHIIGQNMNQLKNLLKNKKFKGTIIEG